MSPILPCANGLYHVTAPEDPPTVNYASIAMVKLTISEAHWKLSHIAPLAIKYTIAKGHITGIQLDPESKPEFCKACAKAKVARQPVPKESKTRASTGTCGDQLRSEASAETHMWQRT